MAVGKLLTEAEKQFIRDHCKTMIVSEIARQIGRSSSPVLKLLRAEGLEQSKELKLELKLKLYAERSTLSKAHDEFIQEQYLNIPVKTIADIIGRSDTIVTTRLRQLGLVIPREIIEQRKLDSQRKKGWQNPDKGKKQHEFMSAETIEKSKATRFQKGNKPKNTIGVIGSITIRNRKARKSSPAKQEKWILVEEDKWVQLQHYNWEQVHGPVPEGYKLRFKDANTLNCEVENLEIISKEQHMRLNTIHNLPPDLKEISILKGAITRQINKHSKL